MELHGDEEGMIGDFDDLDEALGLGHRSDGEAGGFELLAVGGVEFPTVAVAFVDGVDAAVEFV